MLWNVEGSHARKQIQQMQLLDIQGGNTESSEKKDTNLVVEVPDNIELVADQPIEEMNLVEIRSHDTPKQGEESKKSR